MLLKTIHFSKKPDALFFPMEPGKPYFFSEAGKGNPSPSATLHLPIPFERGRPEGWR